jgi:hypothetical protein
MDKTFASQPLPDACLLQQAYGPLLDQAGTNPLEHVVRCVPLEDNVVDSMLVQKLAEQQPRRASPNDRDLRARTHGDVLYLLEPASMRISFARL